MPISCDSSRCEITHIATFAALMRPSGVNSTRSWVASIASVIALLRRASVTSSHSATWPILAPAAVRTGFTSTTSVPEDRSCSIRKEVRAPASISLATWVPSSTMRSAR